VKAHRLPLRVPGATANSEQRMIFSSKAKMPRQDAVAAPPALTTTALTKVTTVTAPTTATTGARPWRCWPLLGACCAALVVGCGGGTSQSDPFVPQRLLAFGDETSALSATGSKYSVNGLTTGNVLDCSLEPIWVQQLANAYGFAFTECNPTSIEPKAFMRAVVGAQVDDVAAQVEAQVAAGGFRDKDLATVLAGSNDVLALYAQYPGRSVDSLLTEARARGKRLAQVVNRLVDLGVKVVISDLPDLGLSPYARAQKALDPNGFDRAVFISSLAAAFSEQLGVNVVLDGRFVGLVQAQLSFQALGRFPGNFNVSEAVCAIALPNCTTATLVAGGNTTSYLWADDTRLATAGHTQLANLAIDRARRNPF
jgi:outer membrane lipase/esterase